MPEEPILPGAGSSAASAAPISYAAVIEGRRPSAIVTTAPRPPAPLGPP